MFRFEKMPPAGASKISSRQLGVSPHTKFSVVKLLNSAAIVEGGTEVVFELTVINGHTGASLANLQTHWQNGGAMVIKGIASLPQDMSAALRAALLPEVRAP
jgi:hypothetical protein